MKILVVDDDDAVRGLVREAMIDQGYQVLVASNANQALELGRETEFDLVFCDVTQLNGFEVLKSFRGELQSKAEMVLMTGPGSVEAAITAVQHDANDYICKPFSVGVLQAIASAVEQRRYPGKLVADVRELKHLMQRLAALCSGIIRIEDLPAEFVATPPVASMINEVIPEGEMPTLEQLESRYLLRVLSAVGGNKSRAAQVMGVDRKTLYRMIDRQVNPTPDKRKVS